MCATPPAIPLAPAGVWDVRSSSPRVAQSEAASGGWTMGVRAQDCRAGAISALVASPDGARVYAATDEGCILGWDTHNLNSTLCVVRLARALGEEGAGGGIVGLSHHPGLPNTLCAQLASLFNLFFRRC